MRFIGITGGAGAGKSELLSYLARRPETKVMLADEIANTLMEPGTVCYEKICRSFEKEEIFLPDGSFDRRRLAEVIFGDDRKRERMNGIVHPAVREYVGQTADREREGGQTKLLVLEAALLIEEHYDEVCDELWYIYAREDVRRERLMRTRGYSQEKVCQILKSQLPEEVYRSRCRVVIDNNGTVEEAFRQLERAIDMKIE